MLIRTYLGALVGSVVGVLVGVILFFNEEGRGDFSPTADDLTPALFFGIWTSGVLLALLIAFFQKKNAGGFWSTLVSAGIGGLIYPVALWFLFVMGVIFVWVPLILLWHFKLYVLIAAGMALLVWMLASQSSKKAPTQ